jgi:hypothetical protein
MVETDEIFRCTIKAQGRLQLVAPIAIVCAAIAFGVLVGVIGPKLKVPEIWTNSLTMVITLGGLGGGLWYFMVAQGELRLTGSQLIAAPLGRAEIVVSLPPATAEWLNWMGRRSGTLELYAVGPGLVVGDGRSRIELGTVRPEWTARWSHNDTPALMSAPEFILEPDDFEEIVRRLALDEEPAP